MSSSITTVPVSVIMPVFNGAATLPRALASIAAQTARPAEILICDDGSTDPAVWPYLQGLGVEFEGIPLKIFRQANAGAGAARNHCLARATAEYVAFLDADDWWLPQKLEHSVAILEGTTHTFVAHNFFAVEPDGRQTLWDCAATAERVDVINNGNQRTHYFYRGFIGILTVVIRRQALLAAGGFNSQQRYALDWECWHAVMAAADKSGPPATFTVFPEALACYSLNPGGLTSKGLARLAERTAYLSRYVRGVARAGGVRWQVLLLRGWLTVYYEIGSLILRRRQWGALVRLLAGMPVNLVGTFWQAAAHTYTRPNFLAQFSGNRP